MNTCTNYSECACRAVPGSACASCSSLPERNSRVSLSHTLYVLRPFLRIFAFAAAFLMLVSILLSLAVAGSVASQNTQDASVMVRSVFGSAALPGIVSGGMEYVEANAYVNEFGIEPRVDMVYYMNTAYYPVVNGAVGAYNN